jgi:kanamycin kinase
MSRIPDDLHDRYAEWRWEKAYEWIEGRPTFRLTAPTGEVRYLKVQPAGTEIPDEATRLRWAGDYVRTPHLIEYGSDGFRDWLMTTELSGVDASRHPWRVSDPARLAVAVGQALRAFHDAIPIGECPFWYPGADYDPDADLVVCHGDFCLPNVFLSENEPAGYLDLGSLAVADRWLDLAVGLRSLNFDFNLGPGYEDDFMSGYGLPLNEDKRKTWLARNVSGQRQDQG